MDDIMIENNILKIKIVTYTREYLKKRGITNPDAKTKIKMRRAIGARLKDEIRSLTRKHDEITRKIYG